jgi:hypothetical protein
MQAIVTKYLGPTNFKGGRVKASCQAKSIIVPWDNSRNIENNHANAAHILATKMGWYGSWVGGGMPNAGFCFVLADERMATWFVVLK